MNVLIWYSPQVLKFTDAFPRRGRRGHDRMVAWFIITDVFSGDKLWVWIPHMVSRTRYNLMW
jgi:hypothetical protein